MNSEIWGPQYWSVIHTIAFNYPNKPNDPIKKTHYKFIQDLPTFIPNQTCSRNFSRLLEIYPVLPYLDSRKDFIKWTHFIHNRVNESLGKDQISLADFYYKYYNSYKSNDVKDYEAVKKRKMTLYLIIVFLLIVFALHISKK